MLFARLGRRCDDEESSKAQSQDDPEAAGSGTLENAVLNSLSSVSSRRSYDHAIRDFIDWYCSEPRLSFNRTVVTRYRIALEQRRYARRPSISGLPQFAGWHTRLPTAASLAPTWPPASTV